MRSPGTSVFGACQFLLMAVFCFVFRTGFVLDVVVPSRPTPGMSHVDDDDEDLLPVVVTSSAQAEPQLTGNAAGEATDAASSNHRSNRTDDDDDAGFAFRPLEERRPSAADDPADSAPPLITPPTATVPARQRARQAAPSATLPLAVQIEMWRERQQLRCRKLRAEISLRQNREQ